MVSWFCSYKHGLRIKLPEGVSSYDQQTSSAPEQPSRDYSKCVEMISKVEEGREPSVEEQTI